MGIPLITSLKIFFCNTLEVGKRSTNYIYMEGSKHKSNFLHFHYLNISTNVKLNTFQCFNRPCPYFVILPLTFCKHLLESVHYIFRAQVNQVHRFHQLLTFNCVVYKSIRFLLKVIKYGKYKKI